MAKTSKPVDPKKVWLCEECGTPHEGVNPPDDCSWCGYKYFENLHDFEQELAATGGALH